MQTKRGETTVDKLLREILDELAAVTHGDVDEHAPNGGPKHKDKVVGEVPKELRPLWAYLGTMEDVIKAREATANEELEAIDSLKAREIKRLELARDLTRLAKKVEIARNAFWAELRQVLWDQCGEADSVGIREKWLVVVTEQKECDCILCRGGGDALVGLPGGLGAAVLVAALASSLRGGAPASRAESTAEGPAPAPEA